MGSLLRRSLKNDTTRSGLYLAIGILLFVGAVNAFWTAVGQAHQVTREPAARAAAQEPAPLPERYVEPAPVEFPFY